MNICSESDCTGCRLCAAICPKNCISFDKMYDGHLYPKIDESKCIQCQKCIKSCISNHKLSSVINTYPIECYAAWSQNRIDHYESASAGLATTLSKYIISKGGTVYGCVYNENWGVEHKGFSCYEDLERLRKSKYIQSYLPRKVLENLKSDLELGKYCLFIGVPCQCAAARNYLKKEYHNFFCVDLLCHGGASPEMFHEHLSTLKAKEKITVFDDITFRGGQNDCFFTIMNKGKILYKRGQFEDEYFLGFMKHIIYRPVCYHCKYASKNRIGDLTLADFWGISDAFLKEHDLKITDGVNLLLINNVKGKFLCGKIENEILLYERSLQEAIDGNETLKCPTSKPMEYDRFYQVYEHTGFDATMHLIYKDEFKRINKSVKKRFVKKIIKSVFPDSMRRIIKSLKNEKV